MNARPAACLTAGFAACLALAGPAAAQLGVSANIQSEYRYRGRPWSEGEPVGALNLSYDHASGLYASGSLMAVEKVGGGVQPFGYVANVGYSARARHGYAWEVGASNSEIRYHRFADRTFVYSEVYAGMQTDHVSLRLHYSPNYFAGQGTQTIYADLGGALRPTENWRVFAHLGVLAAVGGPRFPDGMRYDVSVGAARKISNFELSATFVRGEENRLLPNGRRLDRDLVVLGAAYVF